MQLEELLKDLANCKLQLEAKDSAYRQAILTLESKEAQLEMASTHISQLKQELSSHKLAYEKHIEDLNNQLECEALEKTLFGDYLELKTFELLCLSHDAEKEAKNKLDCVLKRETEAVAEIAILKSELNRERSRIAAAEAAEARINGIKSELYRAMEADKLKMEKKLKRTAQGNELENAKRELEAAKRKIGELRRRAEQAKTRAEAAEKAKMKMEDEFRKWEEQRQRRRAAFASLREECEQREYRYQNKEKTPETYQPMPLGKVLNIKF